ncbi:MAG: alpha/beta hydrolase [Bacteroidales bacterium]|nr:alpha/beta hydrolase [Bacteroidales bacterium]
MKKALLDNKEIAYQAEGQGDCLVLVHGFPEDHRIWEDFSRTLSTFFRVISIDLPGFGESASFGEVHSMSLMASAIKAVVDEENISRFVLAGHSMGGYAALAFADAFQEMLAGLVLFHSQATADDETAVANRNKAIIQVISDKEGFLLPFSSSLYDASFLRSKPAVVEQIRQIALSQSDKGISADLAGMRDRSNYVGLLTQMNCPVLFILGKSDSRMPAVKILSQVGLPRHAELLLLDKVGHMGFVEAPATTRLTLQKFTEKCFSINQTS